MDAPLTLGLALALGVALLAVGVLLLFLLRGREGARADAARARADADALRERVDALAARLDATGAGAHDTASQQDGGGAYVITDAGSAPAPTLPAPRPMVADAVVLNAALGEPLVRAVALGHGVRRALGAESRNRIRFQVRREVRRSRKQRRREMRAAWRAARVRGADPDAGAAPGDPGTRAA